MDLVDASSLLLLQKLIGTNKTKRIGRHMEFILFNETFCKVFFFVFSEAETLNNKLSTGLMGTEFLVKFTFA